MTTHTHYIYFRKSGGRGGGEFEFALSWRTGDCGIRRRASRRRPRHTGKVDTGGEGGAVVVRFLCANMHRRLPSKLLLLAAYILSAHAADTFQLVGNGFCTDAKGSRLKLGPRPETHVQDLNWQSASVGSEGRAWHCEFLCRRQPDCIGYMTEDHKQCDTIKRSDHNSAGGIAGHDSETRNWCWERVQATTVDSECEVWAEWRDGRRERRQCMTVAS